MKETDLNRIINKTLKEEGFSHKIADPLGGTGIQNPYDIYSIQKWGLLNIESKLIKKGLYAFNFKKIEDHQLSNLLFIEKLTKDWNPKPINLIAVGFFILRELFIVMFFDIKFIKQRMDKGNKSIKKKELEKFFEKGKYLTIIRKEGKYVLQDIFKFKDVIIKNE